MPSISNKSYSRNFMIDSKVILHDIFYDTSVKFFLMYLPHALHRWRVWCYVHKSIQHLLTRQIFFSARAVQRYKLPHATSLIATFEFSDSSSHAYATCRSYSLRTDQRHTSCRTKKCSVFACAANTRHRLCFPLEGQWCEYFTLQSTELERSWTWSTPWCATSCHIFFVWMDNQFANENFTEIFVRHLVTTWILCKKCV
jgi:hypothetical protein